MTVRKRLGTRHRTATLEALRDANAFLSAQEVYARLVASGARAGLSTVYRSLDFLAAHGEVDVVRDTENVARYRVCRRQEHHHHLRCRECQKSIELVEPEIEDWAKSVAKRHRFSSVVHELELVGECADCRKADS